MSVYRISLISAVIVGMFIVAMPNASARPPLPGSYDPQTLRFYESGDKIQPDPDLVNTLKAKSYYQGMKKFAVLFICARDKTYTFTVEQWSQQVYTIGTYPTGSIRDYYREVSVNSFDVDGATMGWYTSAYDYSHYTPNYGHDGGAAELVSEAVDQAEAEGIDWSEYDNDGDGIVDAVCVIHQGRDAAMGAPQQIWSHFGYMPEEFQREYDGVKIDRYSMQAEMASETEMATIGTYCHEFGHVLGLPDLYDVAYTSKYAPISNWGIMAEGSDLGVPRGARPAHFTGWSKYKLGWLTPMNPSNSGNYSLDASWSSTTNSLALLPINGSEKEYFLIENRMPRFGGNFDRLPSRWTGGLMIYHVDENMGRGNNGNTDHWFCTAEDAEQHKDTNDKPMKDPADAAFSADVGKTSFTMSTSPDSNGYYYQSQIAITNISATGQTMSFDLYMGPTVLLDNYDLAYLGDDTYELIVYLNNAARGEAFNVMASISTDAGNVVIDDNASTFGNIPGDFGSASNQTNPFVFHTTNSDSQLSPFRLIATGDNGYVSQELTFTVPINPSRILLIDDDQTAKGNPQSFEIAYQEALDLLSFDYETWEILSLGYPPLSVMHLYDLVVWEDGKAALNAPQAGGGLDLIAAFLDSGGDLFYSAHEFIFSQFAYDPDVPTSDYREIPEGEFLREYFHITAVEQDEYYYEASGVPGSMFDGLTYQFVDTFSQDPTGATEGKYYWWPDEFVLEPPVAIEAAMPILTAGTHDFPSGAPAEWADDAAPANNTLINATCAMTYQGEYRLFFMSVPVVCIPTDTAAPLNRQEFMKRVFEWFGVSTTSPGIDIDLNQSVFHGGDNLKLTCRISNPGPTISTDLYILLESYGMFFFHPTWTQDLDSESMTLPSGSREMRTIFSFEWPEGVGSGSQSRFYAALISGSSLVGNFDFCPISWE